jgi:hypothetical protein
VGGGKRMLKWESNSGDCLSNCFLHFCLERGDDLNSGGGGGGSPLLLQVFLPLVIIELNIKLNSVI